MKGAGRWRGEGSGLSPEAPNPAWGPLIESHGAGDQVMRAAVLKGLAVVSAAVEGARVVP